MSISLVWTSIELESLTFPSPTLSLRNILNVAPTRNPCERSATWKSSISALTMQFRTKIKDTTR